MMSNESVDLMDWKLRSMNGLEMEWDRAHRVQLSGGVYDNNIIDLLTLNINN